jgi:hypothetical protein
MQQWEYHEERAPQQFIFETCQNAGKEGWELAGMAPMLMNLGSQIAQPGAPQAVPGALLIFKRPGAVVQFREVVPDGAEVNPAAVLVDGVQVEAGELVAVE